MKKESYDLYCDDDDHSPIISEFRRVVPKELSNYTNYDCLRFIRYCNGDIQKACDKLREVHEWFHTLMDPPLSPLNDLYFSPNTILFSPEILANHPTGRGLLPFSQSGFDKEGRPLYWEKTGAVQSNFNAVKKEFTREELLQFHIYNMMGLEMRYEFATKVHGRPVESAVYIADMKGLTVSLDVDAIWYMKNMITTDLNCFPERYFCVLVINAPWYFPAIYNMFKPLLDNRFQKRIFIAGEDYQSLLEKYIEPSQIPAEYGGGAANFTWDASLFLNDSGISLAQIEQRNMEMLRCRSCDLTRLEMIALHEVFSHPMYKDIEKIKCKRDLLQAWMIDEGVEIEWDESDVDKSQASRITSLRIGGLQSDVGTMSLHSIMRGDASLQVQVCDVLTTKIIGIENRGNHHVYEIFVNFKDYCSWKIKRRYSEFYAYMTKLKKVVPGLNMDKCEMPPKVIFNKMAEKVVEYRSPALDSFLKSTIDNCKSYGTAEQSAIFEFLDVHDNIIRYICSNDEEKESIIEAGRASVVTQGGECDIDSWQTPFTAAVITAWVLMIGLGIDNVVA